MDEIDIYGDEVFAFDPVEEVGSTRLSRTPLERKKFTFKTLGEATPKERTGPVLMSEVISRKIDWLWYPYIPYGKLTMLSGDPGGGKSFITAAIASALSRGEGLPGELHRDREPLKTLMLSAEDDPEDVLRPRLDSFGADLSQISSSYMDIVFDAPGIKAVDQMIADTGAKLLTIDPIVAYMGPAFNMNNANEVRHMMKGLALIAKRRKIAILIVRHNRKGLPGDKAIYSGAGSIDFTASVRSELAIVTSPGGVKFFNHIKSNIGPQGISHNYEIKHLSEGQSRFNWLGPVKPKVVGIDGRVVRTFRDEADVKQWIRDQLKDHPNGVLSKDIFYAAHQKGWSEPKLNQLKKGIAISRKQGSEWVWVLDPSTPIATGSADE